MTEALAVETDHLRTDHLVENLGQRALSGGIVTFSTQGVKFVLNLASAAVLARLLDPSDFGVVGMVSAITGLLALFKDAGLSVATIQREKVTQDQVSNLFWLNILFGGVMFSVSIAVAPLVAWFYHDQRLTEVMWWLSLIFLISGSTVQHQALLTRQMRFKALAVIDVTAMLTGALVGACLALLGLRFWALVGMQLCVASITMAMAWTVSGWSPARPKRRTGVRALVNFGLHLTIADVVACTTANTDSMLIGRSFGASALGLYSRASVLLNKPISHLIPPMASVMVPALSRLQSQPERYRRAFLKVFDALVLVTFACAAVGLVLAKPVILFVLGARWSDAIPLFAGFALAAITVPLGYVPSWLFMSQGRGRDQLRSYLITGPVTVAAYLVGLHWGPLGVVRAIAIMYPAILLPVLFYIAGRSGPVRTADLFIAPVAALPCWAAAYAVTAVMYHFLAHAAPAVQLALCVPAGMGGALAAALCFKRPRATVMAARRFLVDTLLKRTRGENPGAAEEQEAHASGGDGMIGEQQHRRIALYGIFGVQNVGNEYTLASMLHNVRQHAGNVETYCICYEPQDTEQRHGLTAIPIKCSSLARKLTPARNLVMKCLRGVFRRAPLELYDFVRAVWVLRRTDVIIMTGTGMLTDYLCSAFGFPYDVFKWAVAARIARCKVRFVGVGVGPIYSRLSRAFIKTALALADYRGFRDEQSRNRLKQQGYERAGDVVFPDLVFSLPASALPAGESGSDGLPIVGLSVMKFVDQHSGTDYDAVYERYIETMCDFSVWLLTHGYRIRILEGDLMYDPPVRGDLQMRLSRRGIACGGRDIHAPAIETPEDLVVRLSQVDFIVSPRFHSLVFGIMLAKPVISLSYDPKNDVLLESCGLGEYRQGIEAVDLDLLIAQFIKLESNAPHLRVQMKRKADEFRRQLQRQYAQILGNPQSSAVSGPIEAEQPTA